jgi:glucoamylase
MADPTRFVFLQHTKFTALKGTLQDYQVFVLLAPHLGNQGAGNNAWIDDYKGVPMLFAERDGVTLALALSAPWLNRSAGLVGYSDGWLDLFQHKKMTWSYSQAFDGNIA